MDIGCQINLFSSGTMAAFLRGGRWLTTSRTVFPLPLTDLDTHHTHFGSASRLQPPSLVHRSERFGIKDHGNPMPICATFERCRRNLESYRFLCCWRFQQAPGRTMMLLEQSPFVPVTFILRVFVPHRMPSGHISIPTVLRRGFSVEILPITTRTHSRGRAQSFSWFSRSTPRRVPNLGWLPCQKTTTVTHRCPRSSQTMRE